MKKFPKIKRLGDSTNEGILSTESDHLWVQEKLDGGNFRFTFDRENQELVFGSRNVEYDTPEKIDDSFQHVIDHVRSVVDLEIVSEIDERWGDLTFFGEAMHPHTIDYDWDNTPSFIGFAIYSTEDGSFLPISRIEEIFSQLNLRYATRHDVDIVRNGFDCPQSEYCDGPAEGVVVTNDLTGQKAKIRGEKFKEVHHCGSSNKNDDDYEPSDEIVLANKFATEARITKMIHKYRDRGRDIEMAIMEDFWRDVFDDIIEEEFETIFLGNHTIDTQQFRSEVADNCVTVLQQYLNRPDDSVLNQAQ